MPERVDALDGTDLGPVVWASSTLVVIVLDVSGQIVDANATFRRQARRDPRGEDIGAFAGGGQREAFGEWLATASPTWQTRTWGALPDELGLPQDIQFSACRQANGTMILIGEPLVTEDIAVALFDMNETLVTEHRRLDRERDRLDKVSQLDALTGVANRRAFDARLGLEVERSGPERDFSLVILDIDHFKRLNDRYGHQTGDAVLRWLGGLLREQARRSDLVARYGGEEFAAILPDAPISDAAGWAERLRARIARDRPPEVEEIITVSLGVATWRTGDDGSDVVARADRALYRAKEGGRDRVEIEGSSP